MREEKKQMVQELESLLQGRSAILITYQGLTANAFNGFRGEVASEQINGSCHVVKNAILKKAAEALGLDALAQAELSGDTALVSGTDAVALAKAVKKFATGNDKVKVKLSFVEGALLSAKETMALAELPSREVVLAQLLGLLQAPASGIVRAINAKVASILYVLNAVSKKKEEQSA
jgi:large subunit ribosomal protein L10